MHHISRQLTSPQFELILEIFGLNELLGCAIMPKFSGESRTKEHKAIDSLTWPAYTNYWRNRWHENRLLSICSF